MVERFNRRVNEAIMRKTKINANSGKNSFSSHDERNLFVKNFIDAYNRTRLRCLNYRAPLEILNSNQAEYNTCARMTGRGAMLEYAKEGSYDWIPALRENDKLGWVCYMQEYIVSMKKSKYFAF